MAVPGCVRSKPAGYYRIERLSWWAHIAVNGPSLHFVLQATELAAWQSRHSQSSVVGMYPADQLSFLSFSTFLKTGFNLLVVASSGGRGRDVIGRPAPSSSFLQAQGRWRFYSFVRL